jgi:hypothetical protein
MTLMITMTWINDSKQIHSFTALFEHKLHLFTYQIRGFELRAACTLGKRSIYSAMTPALFTLVIFQVGSHIFCPGWARTTALLLTSATWLGLQTSTNTPGLFVERVLLTFCLGWPLTSLVISISWVDGIIGVFHHAKLLVNFYKECICILLSRNLIHRIT